MNHLTVDQFCQLSDKNIILSFLESLTPTTSFYVMEEVLHLFPAPNYYEDDLQNAPGNHYSLKELVESHKVCIII